MRRPEIGALVSAVRERRIDKAAEPPLWFLNGAYVTTLFGAVLIIQNGDSPFARVAFGAAVENHRLFQRSNQLVRVRRHGNRDWGVASIVEVSICNIDMQYR